MFGISAPCAHDWENEFKAINDMEVANLHDQIESSVAGECDVQVETQPPPTSVQEPQRESTTQSITAGEIARRINDVTKASTRVATIAEEDDEDEKALLAKLAAIKIRKRHQAAQNQKQATSKPRQAESSPAQCTHIDTENNTVTMSGTNSTIKVSDLMSVSQLKTEQ